jgi:hypothetical protein
MAREGLVQTFIPTVVVAFEPYEWNDFSSDSALPRP